MTLRPAVPAEVLRICRNDEAFQKHFFFSIVNLEAILFRIENKTIISHKHYLYAR